MQELTKGLMFQVPPPEGIRPFMFKSLVGKGHPEFSTKRQQDAEEFFSHLMTLVEVLRYKMVPFEVKNFDV